MTNTQNPSGNSDQFAQQWIDFLRKRNTMLNIVCLFSIVIALSAGVAAFFFFQQGQTAILENALTQESKSKLESKLISQEELLLASKQSVEETSQSVVVLEEKLSAQSQKLLDAESTLTVNQEIIDNLNAQLTLLKDENEALTGSLSQVRESLLSGASNSEILAGENKRLSEQVSSLNKKLSDRKVAYLAVVKRQKEAQSDFDRLAAQNNELEQGAASDKQRLAAMQQQVAQLRSQKNSLKAELDESLRKYGELEEQLASIMAPIGGAKAMQAKPTQPSPATEQVIGSSTINGSDGLEEIKIQRPVVRAPVASATQAENKAQPSSQNSFDYDKISIP